MKAQVETEKSLVKKISPGAATLDGVKEQELKGQDELQQFPASACGVPGLDNIYLNFKIL